MNNSSPCVRLSRHTRSSNIAEPGRHGHALHEDLPLIAAQISERRRALSWIAAAAAAPLSLVQGCGGGSDDVTTSAGSTTGATVTTSTDTTGATTTATAGSASSCTAHAQETAGPYPADGTNTSSGSTSDVLTASGIVRSDIRASFLTSTTVAQGVQLTLTLTLVNTAASCAPLAGHAVYLWHCDRAGAYSLYSVPQESYLRGVQVSDAAGQVTFTSIFPGCYSGRWPHIHFEVFPSLASATTGRNALLVSQLSMPETVCSAVYSNAPGYSQSVSNLATVSIARDNVFGDNTAAQMAAMTPAMTGSVSAGYTGTATVGVAI